MSTIIPNPPKIDVDFTDARLTGQGGWALFAHPAQRLGLLKGLGRAIDIKRRDRVIRGETARKSRFLLAPNIDFDNTADKTRPLNPLSPPYPGIWRISTTNTLLPS